MVLRKKPPGQLVSADVPSFGHTPRWPRMTNVLIAHLNTDHCIPHYFQKSFVEYLVSSSQVALCCFPAYFPSPLLPPSLPASPCWLDDGQVKSAHAVEREFRVTQALGKAGIPVAGGARLCEDSSVVGTPFYLMDYVPGACRCDVARQRRVRTYCPGEK